MFNAFMRTGHRAYIRGRPHASRILGSKLFSSGIAITSGVVLCHKINNTDTCLETSFARLDILMTRLEALTAGLGMEMARLREEMAIILGPI
ncbi:hypothetical protein MMC22_009545 [Lobaria immixta]|nr:hypothetical protein [Lobaria immixta]